MSKERFRVAIVIPAFNEDKTIGQVVKSITEYGTVIVVNDASTDNTTEEAKKMGAIVINHLRNKGYDAALNSGFEKASELDFDAIITFDADGQHSANLLPEYINKLGKGVDLVLGIRPKTQRFSEWFFAIYTKFLFNWSDPLCGMKGYSMSLYRDRGWFDSFQSIGTELSIYGIINGFKRIEICVPMSKRLDQPRLSSLLKSNFLILRALHRIHREFN